MFQTYYRYVYLTMLWAKKEKLNTVILNVTMGQTMYQKLLS